MVGNAPAPLRGKVIFVAMPAGGRDWLPVRAHDALATCHAVVHDEHADPEILALAPEAAARIGLLRDAAIECVSLAQEGRTVVRLTHAEVLFEGGEEEVQLVARAKVPFEIVPAIRPETAVSAFGGLSFAGSRERDRGAASYAVLRAPTTEGLVRVDWGSLVHATDTLIAHVSRVTLDEVVAALLEHGRSPDTPAMALTDLGRPSQRTETGTLSDIATRARRLSSDARMLVVGDSVERGRALRWFDRRPLFGKRVLVTRTAEQSRSTLLLLRARGADAIAHPTIEIHPPPDPAPMQRALGRLSSDYDFVAFTSENGVACTWEELLRQGRDARAFGKVQIAAIGSGTATALLAHGLKADCVAKEFRGESLAEALQELWARRQGEAGAGEAGAGAEETGARPRILIARALVARDALPEALRAAGWQVDVVAVYETRATGPDKVANLARALEDGAIDAVTFTSKSTVDNFCLALGPDTARLLAKPKVAVIGPITRDAAEARGIRVDVMASPYTVEALVGALEASFAGAYFREEPV